MEIIDCYKMLQETVQKLSTDKSEGIVNKEEKLFNSKENDIMKQIKNSIIKRTM